MTDVLAHSAPRPGQSMPTLFIPHGGGPCFFMDWNPPRLWTAMGDFLRGLAATLPMKPDAILLISAHWEEVDWTVGSAEHPALIYDYYGFPPHTYQLRYPAPGSPDLAARVKALLEGEGIACRENPQRGLDHGVFIPLKLMFPAADIPVVPLSLRADRDARAHLEVGRALAPLRKEGVLIVGSGMSFHNMRATGDPGFGPASDQFDAWLTAAVEADPERRRAALANWTEAPAARLSHPLGEEEHLIPLMVAAGAANSGRGQRIYAERVMYSSLSGYRFD